MKKIRIISRNSDLAMWQARYVKSKLNFAYPKIEVTIVGITTIGDKILDRSLDKVGGKGLFIKELETALMCDAADIAVHSLKDVPVNLLAEFSLAAILKRDDATDAFVSNHYESLESMPSGVVVGTSSARRVAILSRYYPKIQVKLLRGNLPTRLDKLDQGNYDAIILASCGLKRLNLEHRIRAKLDIDQFIPAIGQGSLAIEILKSRSDLNDILQVLNDEESSDQAFIEREIGRHLNAGCSVPIAVHATIRNDKMELQAMVVDKETGKVCSFKQNCNKNNKHKYSTLVSECVQNLIKDGALEILEKYKKV